MHTLLHSPVSEGFDENVVTSDSFGQRLSPDPHDLHDYKDSMFVETTFGLVLLESSNRQKLCSSGHKKRLLILYNYCTLHYTDDGAAFNTLAGILDRIGLLEPAFSYKIKTTRHIE